MNIVQNSSSTDMLFNQKNVPVPLMWSNQFEVCCPLCFILKLMLLDSLYDWVVFEYYAVISWIFLLQIFNHILTSLDNCISMLCSISCNWHLGKRFWSKVHNCVMLEQYTIHLLTYSFVDRHSLSVLNKVCPGRCGW